MTTPSGPTDRQVEVLRLVHARKTLREIAFDLGINSTYAVNCHIDALVRKGMLAENGPRYAKTDRWKLTGDGLAAIGLRECGACCGAGVVSLDFVPGRSAARAGSPPAPAATVAQPRREGPGAPEPTTPTHLERRGGVSADAGTKRLSANSSDGGPHALGERQAVRLPPSAARPGSGARAARAAGGGR